MRRFSFRIALTLAVLMFGAIPALADGAITLEDAWSRATAGTGVGVGYLTINNGGDTPDRLVSVNTAVADKAEIHQTQMADGVMRMRPVTGGVPIPANGTVTFGPSGYHLMLMGLKAPLQKGETFTASLTFEHAGTIEAIFHVGIAGASGPDDPPSDSPEDAQHQH
jgi:copper(I)-binding protein